MRNRRLVRSAVPPIVLGVALTVGVAGSADAETTRTSGWGRTIEVSWLATDVPGAPGNQQVGTVYAENGPFGQFVGGSIVDLQCDSPAGGPADPQQFAAEVADSTSDTVADATGDAIQAVIDGGGSTIDPGAVVTAISDAVVVAPPGDPVDGLPDCTPVRERYFDGGDGVTVAVDTGKKIASLSGTVAVTGPSVDGETPGPALGTIKLAVTVKGGDWRESSSSTSVRGADYVYKSSRTGKAYDAGAVTGTVGEVKLAGVDAYASYEKYSFRTFEHVR